MRSGQKVFKAIRGIRPGDVLSLVQDFEQRQNVLLCVHDLVGVLALPDGTRLFPDVYFSHRHPVCRAGRPVSDPAAEAACLGHCWRAAHAFGSRGDVPFEHRCWRGQRELVVPIFHDGLQCLALFVKPRDPRWPRPERIRRVAADVRLIGQQLIRLAEEGGAGPVGR